MTDPLYLAIDLGTSSVRAALVDRTGRVIVISSRRYNQVIPRFSWAEQSASGWWEATAAAIAETVSATDASRIAAICTCGQMHGAVLVDAAGTPTRDAVLIWNDKRAAAHVAAWDAVHDYAATAAITANPATPAWPAFKLQWLRDNDAASYAAAATVLTPKDFINFRLTGRRATDWTEASASYLADAATGEWAPQLLSSLGLRADLLPEILAPTDILGTVDTSAARLTGLRAGTPVLAGGGDLPVALLGSGAFRPGVASDITGTSAIATLLGDAPVRAPLVSNVAVPGGAWGAFTLVDAGGDSVRWIDRLLGPGTGDDEPDSAPPGSDGLFYLPYLSGERLGPARNSRGQFFGLTSAHGRGALRRAVLEGVSMALKLQFDRLGARPDHFITAGAAGRSELWLRIKASLYGVPLLVPRELECGAIGCAILCATATGDAADLANAAARMVAIDREVAPDPAWQDHYERHLPVFSRISVAMRPLYDELDHLER